MKYTGALLSHGGVLEPGLIRTAQQIDYRSISPDLHITWGDWGLAILVRRGVRNHPAKMISNESIPPGVHHGIQGVRMR